MESDTRHDIYGPIHKALRQLQCTVLRRLSVLDYDDAGQVGGSCQLVIETVEIARSHLEHEEKVIHKALRNHCPELIQQLEEQHHVHRGNLGTLEALAAQIPHATQDARVRLGRELYLSFTRFMAHDFDHMAHEELQVLPVLQSLYGDDQLRALEGEIVASIPPAELIRTVSAILAAALSPDERVKFMDMVRLGAPPEAFAMLMNEAARPALSSADYDALAHRLAA